MPGRGHAAPKPPKPTKRRNCLRCARDFDSVGNWNWICPKCNGRNALEGGRPTVHVSLPDRGSSPEGADG